MSKEKILRATHEGKIQIGDNELNCAVLEDGTRIISASAIFKAFGRTKRGRKKDEIRVLNMPSFIDANNVQPFIDNELKGVLNQVDYYEKNGKTLTSGYNALILPMLCKVYLDARAKEVLKPQQMPLARASEVLLLGLSRLGIIALVDEATGYQYNRERDELQKILKAYISEELLVWQKTFPDEFYKEIFRLNRWDYTVHGIKQRPGVIGTWTNKLIYEQLPRGVLKELKSKTPKTSTGKYAARFFQSLTNDVGNPHLKNQLVSVITLMNISRDWKEFIKFFNKKFGQQIMEFEEQKTIAPQPPPPQINIDEPTEIDEGLITLLNTPPEKKGK